MGRRGTEIWSSSFHLMYLYNLYHILKAPGGPVLLTAPRVTPKSE